MDKSPPRNGLIAFYAALAVVILFSLKPLFDSYFDAILSEAQSRHQVRAYVGVVVSPTTPDSEDAAQNLQAKVEESLWRFHRCYEPRLQAEPHLEGLVTFNFRLSSGRVEFSNLQNLTGDTDLGSCASDVVEQTGAPSEVEGSIEGAMTVGFARTRAGFYASLWRARSEDIEAAVLRLGRQGRRAFAQIQPQPSTTRDPVLGWSQRPQVDRFAPPPEEAASPQTADDGATGDEEGAEPGAETVEVSAEGSSGAESEPTAPEGR